MAGFQLSRLSCDTIEPQFFLEGAAAMNRRLPDVVTPNELPSVVVLFELQV
jgi:hypothetical protein